MAASITVTLTSHHFFSGLVDSSIARFIWTAYTFSSEIDAGATYDFPSLSSSRIRVSSSCLCVENVRLNGIFVRI